MAHTLLSSSFHFLRPSFTYCTYLILNRFPPQLSFSPHSYDVILISPPHNYYSIQSILFKIDRFQSFCHLCHSFLIYYFSSPHSTFDTKECPNLRLKSIPSKTDAMFLLLLNHFTILFHFKSNLFHKHSALTVAFNNHFSSPFNSH